ncbi:MAG: HipA domain-containing protein [Tannerella sp.]|jgi:serine/threonine-protein kinase HipA|nr:HipA domain-containing protein [Tannerella sp.]
MTLNNCPGTLAAGYNTYSQTALHRVFDNKKVSHLLDFSNDDKARAAIDENIIKISISGVQEKLSAVINNGRIVLTPEGIQGRYIIKPIPDYKRLQYRHFMPANEHLTMQIARQVYHINTAENALIFFRNEEPAYITKRFDVKPDGSKIQQEDFASLLGKTIHLNGNNFKYTGDYLDIKRVFTTYVAAWKVEAAKFFKLVVFNYIFANGDAHLKNFSLQKTPNEDYILSPAYDLINSSLHVDDQDFALEGGLFPEKYHSDIHKKKGQPCQDDFKTFGELLAIPENQISKIIQEFAIEQPFVYELIERSYFDDRMKRMYKRSYKERLSRFNREC